MLCTSWQRCRAHFMRNVLAHAGRSGRRVVSAFIATAFAKETPETASTPWRSVADQKRPKASKLVTIVDQAEPDVLDALNLASGQSHSRCQLLFSPVPYASDCAMPYNVCMKPAILSGSSTSGRRRL